MNFNLYDVIGNFKYGSLKHNIVASYLFEYMIKSRAKNLKSLIFTATTGRSGTKSLAKIFQNIDSCNSYHEPYPTMMNDENMINRNNFNDQYTEWVYKYIKSVNIKRYAKRSEIYFESNHAFIKSFHDHVINEFGEKVKVIHVYRNPIKVANSIYSIGNIPGTDQGNMWWLNYRGNYNKINIASILDNDSNFRNDFYKCLWYWYEIESRVQYCNAKYRNIKFIDFKTEDMNNFVKIRDLLYELDVTFDEERIKLICNIRENLKEDEKIRQPINEYDALRMNDKFLKMLIKNGYDDIVNSIIHDSDRL